MGGEQPGVRATLVSVRGRDEKVLRDRSHAVVELPEEMDIGSGKRVEAVLRSFFSLCLGLMFDQRATGSRPSSLARVRIKG